MIAIISHDAGGAEIISSYISQHDLKKNCVFSLSGPAVNIFEGKLGKVINIEYQAAIEQCDWMLSGTSWQSQLEWKAIEYSRLHNKKSVVFLDHWVNYKERFIYNNIEHLPDELWVGDHYAEELVRQYFKNIPVLLVENPYIKQIHSQLEKIKALYEPPDSRGKKILYVCEPVAEHMLLQFGNERHLGYTEHDALKYFLENLEMLGEDISEIVIRPHPSEVNYSIKYDWVFKEFRFLNMKYGGKKSLLEEVVISDIVVGCESMAMIVGIEANKRVVSTIPPQGIPCKLPHTEIEKLSNLKRDL